MHSVLSIGSMPIPPTESAEDKSTVAPTVAPTGITAELTVDGTGVRVPPRDSNVWKTPMFEQYWPIRDSLGENAILFYRMGDFFELFGNDAIVAAPLLEVQLTARNKDAEIPVPMCGVPVHALDSYAEKALAHGLKIAICEQVSDPAAAKSKLVERRISRILTPGLPIDFSRLEAKAPHWFLSIGFAGGAVVASGEKVATQFEIHAFDLLGGMYHYGVVDQESAVVDLVKRISPKEILIPASWLGNNTSFPIKDLYNENVANSVSRRRMFTLWPGHSSSHNFREYLMYTQRCAVQGIDKLLPAARPLDELLGTRDAVHARIPQKVLEQWAVFPELYDLLDRSGSVLGSRRLRQILSHPLFAPDRIDLRQRVFALLKNFDLLREKCREVYDLERILGRFRIGVAASRELVQLKLSLDSVIHCIDALPKNDPTLLAHWKAEGLEPYPELRARIEPLALSLNAILQTDVDAGRADGVAPLIKSGFDIELDRLRNLNQTAEKWLIEFEEEERKRSGINSLKVRYNRVFGFYIEIRKGHLEKVPADYQRKQTTAQGERYTNTTLKEKEDEILNAADKLEARARKILEDLQLQVLGHDSDLRVLFDHFSWLDALLGIQFAVRLLSRHNRWNFATVSTGPFFLRLENARHPVIEALHGDFVPNSLDLGVGKKRILLLTGPNMAGKSTLMRQTGLCMLLAQCGLPVPAEKMDFAPCSGFFSRMGASDRILDGESTFMVEMKESAEILREADENSLVLIDEIGRGTSTQDGLAIAQAVLEHLHNHTRCLAIFATHYHELSESVAELPNAINASMAIREWRGDLIFLRKVKFEPAASSHGIYVAKVAGLPRELVQRAQKLLLLIKNASPGIAKLKSGNFDSNPGQLGIFEAQASESSPSLETKQDAALKSLETVGRELSDLDLNALTPRDAWLKLEELQNRLTQKALKESQHESFVESV